MNRDQNGAEDDAAKPASTAGLTTKVVKGSMWTLAGQVAPLIFTFASTYFVVRIIAAEGMGVLAALVLIPNYFTFADLGMSLASTKFASEAYADGDTKREGQIIRTAALIAMLTAMPIAAAFILFSVPILVYFNVPENYLAEASTALRIGSVTFLLNFLCSIVNTPQLSRLRMDLNTFINASTRIAGIVATPVVLHFGFGIVGVATALFVANLACLIGHLVVSGRLLGGKLFEFSIGREMLRPLLNYGFAYIAAATAGVFLINGEKGILTNSTSTTTLAFYTASFTLASMLTMFSGSVVQSLLPAFAQLQTEERKDHLGSLYSTGVRLNLIWIVPTIAFLFVVAKPFFTIYYHRDPRFGIESPGPFYILLAGVAFNIVAYLPYSSIMAAGRVNALAKLFWIEVVPYLVMTVFLTRSFGIIGAAMSWTIRAVIDSVIQFIMASRIANVRFDVRDFGVRSFGAMLIFVPTAVLCVVRPEELLWIVPLFFISLAVYSVFAWRVLLSGLEREWLANRARMMFPAKTQS